MSRVLPDRPNLDHLKKQARHLLRAMRRNDPSARLADALHVLAREYGFASWPLLKAHVESLAEDIEPSFDRYTFKARQALFFSRYIAGDLGSLTIESEHVLMGVIQAASGVTNGIFQKTGPTMEQVRSALRAAPDRDKLGITAIIPFGEASRRVVRHAAAEANQLSHAAIGMVHIVLGILRDEHSDAAALLRRTGVSLETLRSEALTLLNAEPS